MAVPAAGWWRAAAQTRDRLALRADAPGPDRAIERRIDALIRKMTLEEKLNQLTLLSDGQIKDTGGAPSPSAASSASTDPAKIDQYQQIAVEQSRLHIPILFAFDTIHGFRTIFPIPLGDGAQLRPRRRAERPQIGAFESATVGLKQIYSPMVDVSHEPRWGRISEAAGEDPYLNSVMAAARVKGAQGNDYCAPDKVVTSVKHYAAYGQPECGPRLQHDRHVAVAAVEPLPAAVQGRGRRRRGHRDVLVQRAQRRPGLREPLHRDRILKGEWGFDGFIESDYTAVAELRAARR